MLQASKAYIESVPKAKRIKYVEEDLIVYKAYDQETYDEQGRKITERVLKPVNLTKKVNETAKLIKKNTAEEKLAELEKLLQK